METALKLWAIIAVVGLLNYLSRLSFIALFARRTMPPLAVRTLRYVPAAMLTALTLPMILSTATQTVHVDARMPAALVAAIVAFRTRSTLWTLVAGMAALWLLRAAFPALG